MKRPTTAILRYEASPDSLKDLLEHCRGLEGLRTQDRVFIKPNLVALDERFPIPLFGVLTTTRLVHDMVILLKERGVDHITIGEGSVYGKGFGVPTEQVFEALGYPALRDRYGVRLVDIHQGAFSKVDFGDFPLEISHEVLESDFLVNMPVLKTHNQAMVSLGLKNLKGCISMKSRKACHSADGGLERHLARFVEKISPSLTVLDGVYGLEKGPYYAGDAVRTNVLVASKDTLSVDVAGAAIAGFDPRDIPHIRLCAERQGASADPKDLVVAGEPIETVQRRLKWDHAWREDDTGPLVWDRMGIAGVRFPKYDSTICTGCSGLYTLVLVRIMASFRGAPFDEIEILTGKTMKPSGKARKSILMGNCMIKANRKSPDIQEAVWVEGCPPTAESLENAMIACGFDAENPAVERFLHGFAERYQGKPEFDEAFFSSL
ncbi:MAG: DUF362 domain-containing protein [Desulfobacteraceae bacterium]